MTTRPTRATRRWILPAAAFAVGLVALGTSAVLVVRDQMGTPIAATSSIGGPWTLAATTGGTISSADIKGKPYLIFFGFTRCPDICPTTLSDMSDVIDRLRKEKRDIRAFFVTVDPERDTTAVLKNYLASFDGTVVGLTGSPDEIAAVKKEFRVYAEKVPLKDGDYTMSHTALVYVMNGANQFVTGIPTGKDPDKVVAELRPLIDAAGV